MQNLRNPKWLLFINTLPLILLFLLFFNQFGVIKTLLEDDSIQLWKSFSVALGFLGMINFVYAIILIVTKKKVSVWYGLLALLCYIPFLYAYGYHLDEIFPRSIPQWMMSDLQFIYAGTFLMPTLMYALFILVVHFTLKNKVYKAWVDFLIAIGVPIVGYLFVVIIIPLRQKFGREFWEHSMLILTVVATLIFLFFLSRAVFILTTKKAKIWQKYQLAWKIPIAIILPLIGLSVNNGHLFNEFGIKNTGIFGNFNSIWFYILAVVNGVLVCLPNLKYNIYRLLLFVGRSLSFAYTLYFFLVFLPFLPLSVVAIIAIGLGFLMLTPLLLFVVHTNELSKDFSYLKTQFSKQFLIVISIFSFLVIPTFITISYLKDKRVLNETLLYVYSPDYSKDYAIDKEVIQKNLDIIKRHKEKNRGVDGIFGNTIPYLSSYFNWLVMDNLTLSEQKINHIESIFFGKEIYDFPSENGKNKDILISNISTTSTYDKNQKVWKSWVDLEITNNSEMSWNNEYSTVFDLPEGAWISDYYLYVGDKKEPGILSEKKAAMWVFSQIRNRNRDPGILYYLTGNKVSFKVFPFAKNEIRKTGIEFLHKEPITLTIDHNVVALGKVPETNYETVENDIIAYVSTQEKQALKVVKRKPYFHFLLDVSKEKNKKELGLVNRLEQVLATNKELAEGAKISFVNTYVTTTSIDANWKEAYENQSFEGGFYLERAIQKTLFNAYQDKSESYPVIVVVTDAIEKAILKHDFSDFKFAFPESNLFLNLDIDGNLKTHSLTKHPLKALPETARECMFCETVLAYPMPDKTTVYLPNTNTPSIVLKKEVFDISETTIEEKNWQTALLMQGQWMSQTLHPEITEIKWLQMVKNSFVSKIMTPVTSYMVVENEAQKAMLKKKQKQVLSGNKSLDLDDDTRQMSEPSLLLLALLLGVIVGFRKLRERRRINYTRIK